MDSFSTSKVNVLLRTSFKNRYNSLSRKSSCSGSFLGTIFGSKSIKKSIPRDIKSYMFVGVRFGIDLGAVLEAKWDLKVKKKRGRTFSA